MTDYTAMEGWQMLSALKDDGRQWAIAFAQHAKKLGYSEMDEGWLIGWFANAIEASSYYRRKKSTGGEPRGEAHTSPSPTPPSGRGEGE